MRTRPSNPYYSRGTPSIASGGVSVPVRSYAPSSAGTEGFGALANLFSTAIGAATYDPENDPQAQLARYRRLQGDDLEAQRKGRGDVANLFGSIDLTNPESVATAVRGITTAVAASGGNPDSVSDLMRFLVANTPGTTEDTVGRAAVGAGGSPRGADSAYTVAGQDAIRRDNERVGDERNTADNIAAGERNDATVAGAMERAVLEEGGRNTRANADRTSAETLAREKPVVASAGSTVLTAPGDVRTTQTTVPDRPNANKPVDVSPQDVKTMEEMILRSLPEGAEVEDGVVNSILQRASEIYQETRNAGTAVQKAIEERASIGDDGGYFGTGIGADPTVKSKGADPLGIR